MMPHMQAGESGPESASSAYSGYTGAPGSTQQPYGQSAPGGAGGLYDDNFVDDLADRIAQRTGSGNSRRGYSGKIHLGSGGSLSAGQRLALAIISVVALIPLSGIIFSFAFAVGAFGSIIGFGCACFVIFCINLSFRN